MLSRDTEEQLRQKPTFIDESAKYKLSCILKKRSTSCVFLVRRIQNNLFFLIYI